MRSLLPCLLLAALGLVVPAAQAQVCQGDIILGTQAEVEAFDCTEFTGNLTIDSSSLPPSADPVTSLSGLSELTTVSGYILVRNNDALTSLAGLGNLSSVGKLWIWENDALASFASLDNLTSVGGLSVANNAALTSLTGLENLTSVGGGLQVINNNALTSLTGLGNLTSVVDDLAITNNAALTSLAALASLTSVEGYLLIHDNDVLTSLEGLENITSVGSYLAIERNDALLHLDHLAAVGFVGGDLEVIENPSLSACSVGLAPLLLEGTLGGTHTILNNAPGCNSYWEAIGGAVDAEDEATPLVTALAAPYPNPSAGAATLSFTLAESAEVTLTVYDVLGRRVVTLAEGQQAAGEHEVTFGAGLPAGVYVVRLTVGEETWTERVTLAR